MKSVSGIIKLIVLAMVIGGGNAGADEFTATVEDAIAMQNCIEAVRDVNANLEPGQRRASQRECIGAASGLCMEQPAGGSTIGMVTCVTRETDWWDGQLNGYYRYLKQNLDTRLFTSLRDVQRKWIAYKEAACQFEYDSWDGGTIRQPAAASCFLDVTAIRTIELGELVSRLSAQ